MTMSMNTVDITHRANELLVKWSNGRDKAIADYHYYCGLIDGINQYLSGLNSLGMSGVMNGNIGEESESKQEQYSKQEREEQANGNSHETRIQRTEDSEAL